MESWPIASAVDEAEFALTALLRASGTSSLGASAGGHSFVGRTNEMIHFSNRLLLVCRVNRSRVELNGVVTKCAGGKR